MGGPPAPRPRPRPRPQGLGQTLTDIFFPNLVPRRFLRARLPLEEPRRQAMALATTARPLLTTLRAIQQRFPAILDPFNTLGSRGEEGRRGEVEGRRGAALVKVRKVQEAVGDVKRRAKDGPGAGGGRSPRRRLDACRELPSPGTCAFAITR